eukprot:6153199-Prymnesium_polylepis.1
MSARDSSGPSDQESREERRRIAVIDEAISLQRALEGAPLPPALESFAARSRVFFPERRRG